MKRPLIATIVIAYAGLIALFNGLDLPLTMIQKAPPAQVAGNLLLTLVVFSASLYVCVSLQRRKLRSTRPISVYLWGMFLAYPLGNALRAIGLNLPLTAIRPQEMVGAAVFEIMRLLVPLILIICVGLSAALKRYLTQQSPALVAPE